MRRLVFASESIEVVHRPGNGRGPVIVTFDSFADRPALPRKGFGEDFFSKRGICAYHFTHATNEWYQYPELPDAISQIRREIDSSRQVITYGSSMGGYAAFRFSGLLNAAKVIALSPQYSIDPAAVPWERRWRPVARQPHALWDHLPVKRTAECMLFYDPKARNDARHARLIGSQFAHPHNVPVHHGGHPCIAVLQETGLLEATLHSIIENRFDARHLLSELRRSSDRSASFLSNKALAMCHLARSYRLSLIDMAVELAPREPHYQVARAYLMASYGMWTQAELSYLQAINEMPDNMPALRQYQHFLERQLRWDDAAAVGAKIGALDAAHHNGVNQALWSRKSRITGWRAVVRRQMLTANAKLSRFLP